MHGLRGHPGQSLIESAFSYTTNMDAIWTKKGEVQ